ncbi:MAG: radical SAM protein, partial [Anaerolineae bacterium]
MTVFSVQADPAVLYDSYGRHLHYLRVSLTDACNLRCIYCMPEDIVFRPPASLLQDDEILTLIRVAASLGVDKIRLTGGEPTVRRGVVDLVRQIKAIPGIKTVAMTTNGIKLAELARPLAESGLNAVNISIDSLDPEKYRMITRRGELTRALDGLEAALEEGLEPVKVNVVILRHVNDEVEAFAELVRRLPVHVRFIEYMSPCGACDPEL